MNDFNDCAKAASMKRRRAETIINEIRATVFRWKDYAEEACIPVSMRDQIHRTLRLGLW